MVSGQSVGREGPSAHLGAASSNLPAQALHLPNNSLRILAACGAAAGIAASFNTPLAGAAFAMEVLLMEYTVAGFAPVILATVSATALSRAVFGDELAYLVPTISLGSLAELPYILLCGILFGMLAGGFTELFLWVIARTQSLPVWLRPILAGLLVGVCGMAVPEVMGIGDDTVSGMLLGEFGIQLLLLFLLVKLIASTAIALGLPGGVIGPILFIGAAAGGVLGGTGAMLGVNGADEISLYVLIGMGAMFAGTMMAPMAGLIAILELTGEPGILLPAMLAVVAATIVSGRISKRESLFHGVLNARGLTYRNDPLVQSLRRIGVASVMERRVVELARVSSVADVDRALADHPVWILVREQDRQAFLLAAIDLLRAHKESPGRDTFDLLELPGERLQTYPIDNGATLEQAWNSIRETGGKALYVVNQSVPGLSRVYGVLTPAQIENSYRYGA
jgi:chloride channel protein, CIC family